MTPRVKRGLSIATFAALAGLSFLAAYALRFGGEVPAVHWDHMVAACGCAVGVKVFSFCWHRLDLSVNRYIAFQDLITIGKATVWSTLGLTLVDALLLPHESIPRGVILIDGVTTLVAFGMVRSAPRVWRDLAPSLLDGSAGRRVLIVGANDHGETLLRSLHASDGRFRAVGFLDDNPSRLGQRIGGVPVVGSPSELTALVARLSAEGVLVTGGVPGRTVRAVMDEAASLDIPVRVLPSYDQLLRGDVAVQPRDVAIEDLLRREPAKLDNERIGEWIRGRVVLVTGSAGSIGSEICRQVLSHEPAKLVALDRSETGQFFLERELERIAPGSVEVVLADTNDRARLDSVFGEHRPAVVFHAAAYKHVPLMERHPGEAVKNIALATRNVADAAEAAGAESFVMVSTDKAVRPTSVMGSCKQIAERYVQAKSSGSDCRFVTVRFGNVLDSAGSVIPIFREQIARGGPVTVTHEEINRFFMTIPEAAQLVVQAGAMGRGGEIFVLDMGEPVRIIDLARDMIRLSGLRAGEDIEVRVTGLRPGEKLYEELYCEAERHTATSHEKITVADSQPTPLIKAMAELARLDDIADGSNDDVQRVLLEIAPRYDSRGGERRAAA